MGQMFSHPFSMDMFQVGAPSARDHNLLRLNEQIMARVAYFNNSRSKLHIEQLFKKHTNEVTNLMTVDSMRAALHELGIQLTQDEAAVVFGTVDTDENGGLDLQEFMKAVEYPSKLQQWLNTLPLSQLLAHCLSFKADNSNDLLREVRVVYICGLTPVKFIFRLRLQKISPS